MSLPSGKALKSLGSLLALLCAGDPMLVMGQAPATAGPPLPASTVNTAAAATTNQSTARIQFANPVFDFGKISSGASVKHTFYFTNTGTSTLTLSGVQTSCGCTAAGEWSKRVEPGQTGSIPIQFESRSFNGPIVKTVSVASNDPLQPVATLQVKGVVWKPIDIYPAYVILNMTPESTNATSTLTITNNMESPVEIWGATASNPAFQPELKTNAPGKGWQIVVSTSGKLNPGSIQGTISAQTSATNVPMVTVTAWANVQPPITIVPPVINLPRAPLANIATPMITVINNTQNALVLSNATINAPGVEVRINEIQKGRYFSVSLAFPKGFEVPLDRQVEFSVASNHPKHPEIRLPVQQQRAPAQPVQEPPASIALPSAPGTAAVDTAPGLTPTAGIRHLLPRTVATPPAPPSIPSAANAAAALPR